MTSKLKLLSASSAVAAIMMASTPALATTQAGTDVLNTASVTYQVAGVTQTAPPVATNTFRVDRRVLYTLVEDGGASTSVTPGQISATTAGSTAIAATRFVLTNTSNDALGFDLTAADLVGNTVNGNSDDFNITTGTLRICVEGATPLTCLAAPTTTLSVNSLARDTGTVRILVVGDIPIAPVAGDSAAVRLSAVVREAGAAGAAIVYSNDTDVNVASTMQTIWGVPGALAADRGRRSADDDYLVAAPVLAVTKYSRVVSDGVTAAGAGNFPKAIPGAVVEYCILIANSGTAPASSVSISDDLGLVGTNTRVVYNASTANTGTATVATDANGNGTCTLSGTTTAGSLAGQVVSGTIASVPAASSAALVFRVTIQ
jgi:uncharacterized repeat protein (TIGR01451 family)